MNEKRKETEFLQSWKSFSSFKGQAAFSTWMYRVDLNTATTMIKNSNLFVDTKKASAVPDESDNRLEFSEDLKILYIIIISNMEK